MNVMYFLALCNKVSKMQRSLLVVIYFLVLLCPFVLAEDTSNYSSELEEMYYNNQKRLLNKSKDSEDVYPLSESVDVSLGQAQEEGYKISQEFLEIISSADGPRAEALNSLNDYVLTTNDLIGTIVTIIFIERAHKTDRNNKFALTSIKVYVEKKCVYVSSIISSLNEFVAKQSDPLVISKTEQLKTYLAKVVSTLEGISNDVSGIVYDIY